MAWPVITAYTAAEKTKVKADLTEASAQIAASIAAELAQNGKDTRTAAELTAIKAIIDARNTAIV
jgi:hypothetical protein